MSWKNLVVGSTAVLTATSCLSAARRSSGAIGCPASEITISDESVGLIGDNTWTATCRGRTYYCSMNAAENSAANVTCAREGGSDDTYSEYASPLPTNGGTSASDGTQPTAPKEGEAAPPPPGVAGLEFGMTEEDAASVCARAGYTWHGDAKPGCSGAPVSVGIDSEVQLRFCDGGLCRAALTMTRGDREFDEIKQTFVKLVKALRQKYGKARLLEIPDDACARDIPQCLRTGNGAMQAAWQWKGGHAIRVTVAVGDDNSTLTLLYKAPEATTSKALQGL